MAIRSMHLTMYVKNTMYTFFKSSREELLTWKDKSIIQLKHKILHTTFINSKPSGKDWFYNDKFKIFLSCVCGILINIYICGKITNIVDMRVKSANYAITLLVDISGILSTVNLLFNIWLQNDNIFFKQYISTQL